MPVDMLQTPFMSQPALMASRDEDFVKAMLAVELALAETQESLGIIPSGSAGRMRAALESHVFDVSAITTGIATGGNFQSTGLARVESSVFGVHSDHGGPNQGECRRKTNI